MCSSELISILTLTCALTMKPSSLCKTVQTCALKPLWKRKLVITHFILCDCQLGTVGWSSVKFSSKWKCIKIYTGGRNPLIGVITGNCSLNELEFLLKGNWLTGLTFTTHNLIHLNTTTVLLVVANLARNCASPPTCTAQISRVWTPPIPSAHSSHSPLWK